MIMKYNDKFFSFPPFISTSWENVSALGMNLNEQMVFHLSNGDSITLPPLAPQEVDAIFLAHAAFLEKQVLKEPLIKKERPQPPFMPAAAQEGDFPIRFAFGSMDGSSAALQHNPAQAGAPDLPEEMLAKIGNIAKIIAPDDPQQLPKPEPHCNCFHCQIARALISGHQNSAEEEAEVEELVTENELQFNNWKIEQTGDKLYTVINKLDTLEKYSVYLGHPVGCTCGKHGCEHILVVLKS